MDNTLDIRKSIHNFVDTADERILRIISAFIVAVDSEGVFSFPGLEKRINEARKEKKEGKLKTVNPKNVWENIS